MACGDMSWGLTPGSDPGVRPRSRSAMATGGSPARRGGSAGRQRAAAARAFSACSGPRRSATSRSRARAAVAARGPGVGERGALPPGLGDGGEAHAAGAPPPAENLEGLELLVEAVHLDGAEAAQ